MYVDSHSLGQLALASKRTASDAKFKVAEIGAVNMDDIGAVRKRSRSETGPHDSSTGQILVNLKNVFLYEIGLIAIREVSPPFDEEQQY